MESNLAGKIDSQNLLRIIVVGAGVAGLSCARNLIGAKWNQKIQVIILEGRERVGGRIETRTFSSFSDTPVKEEKVGDLQMEIKKRRKVDFNVDMGASYVHGCNRYNPVFELLVHVNIKRFFF